MNKGKKIKNRLMNYLEKMAKVNEREFGFGSLSLSTFERIYKK